MARKFIKISDEDRRKITSTRYETVPQRPKVPSIRPDRGMKWVPDWEMSDEFYGDSNFDWQNKSKWEFNNHNWAGRAPGFFKRENVFIQDNELRLRSQEESTVPTELNISDKYHSFSTAFVRTHKARQYGYFEIMCKLMDSKISSAFWFKNREGDLNTELDVFEFSTSDKVINDGDLHYCRLFSTNVHVHSHPDKSFPQKYKDPVSYDIGINLSQRKIKVGFNWQKDYIEWYLNDVLLRKEKNLYFDQALHLQLDSETMGEWFGLPEKGDENLPGQFRTMYVRTWYQAPK